MLASRQQFQRAARQFRVGPHNRASAVLAVGYISAGLVIPFVLPLKSAFDDANADDNIKGAFNTRSYFRI